MSHYKAPEEMFPNLFAPEPAKPAPRKAKTASPSDMRLVQFLMRQMGTRKAPARQPSPIPQRPAVSASRTAPVGRPAPAGSRPLPRAAQR